MNQACYAAAWTDSGCFLTRDDHHVTIREAVACIPCAGGYVVGVEDGVMRSLTAHEEAEFQLISHPPTQIPPALPVGRSTCHPAPRREAETLVEIALRAISTNRFGRETNSELHFDSIYLADLQRARKYGDAPRAGDDKEESNAA